MSHCAVITICLRSCCMRLKGLFRGSCSAPPPGRGAGKAPPMRSSILKIQAWLQAESGFRIKGARSFLERGSNKVWRQLMADTCLRSTMVMEGLVTSVLLRRANGTARVPQAEAGCWTWNESLLQCLNSQALLLSIETQIILTCWQGGCCRGRLRMLLCVCTASLGLVK